MNLKDMNLQAVDARLAELDTEVRSAESVEAIDAAGVEKKSLLERRTELADLEQRKQTALELNAGTKEPDKIIETRKAEKQMDNAIENLVNADLETRRSSEEYRSAFLMGLQGKPLSVEQRALVNATAAIPTQTWNQIVEKMEYISPILTKITLSEIPGYLSIPVENATADAAWVAMGTAATDSADSLSTVSLSAYKLIKTVEIGADVSAMAIPAFESYLVAKLSKKMAKALENAVLNGTGSSQATGLLATGIVTNTGTYTKTAMDYKDLLTIIGNLPDHGYRQNASLVMPSALFYSDVIPALTSQGIGLDVQAMAKQLVFNYPVILCDRIAADTILFGDLSYYHMNIGAPVTVEFDKSVGFRTGSTVYRALTLADGKPTNVAAFNVYKRSAT